MGDYIENDMFRRSVDESDSGSDGGDEDTGGRKGPKELDQSAEKQLHDGELIKVTPFSFGFGGGPRPPDSVDKILDFRKVVNPSVASRKGRTGSENRLREEVRKAPGTEAFIENCMAFWNTFWGIEILEHVLGNLAREKSKKPESAEGQEQACEDQAVESKRIRVDIEVPARSHDASEGARRTTLTRQEPLSCSKSTCYLRFAFGCHKGKHRSVSVVVEITKRLRRKFKEYGEKSAIISMEDLALD
ncbi:unnamed protein product [Amoebophrya sp. A25]|nr:unnamed protein product [Amoebophrya sp. A25]|eukprot:GSA25T00016236001.1